MQVEILNNIYEPLNECKTKIINYLNLNRYSYKWGYYSGHYVKSNNKWLLEHFPIPVITVEDICDIRVDLAHIFIEGKLKRECALKFDFSLLKEYRFEVYGVQDYLNDFYNAGLSIEGIKDRILSSNEAEIGVSLFISHEGAIENILSILGTLKRCGFYS